MTRRRRGQELETDILRAVSREIAERGYTALTYEGVAAAAQTSKPVLYRRWSSKAEMVMAAMVNGARDALVPAADTGSLRGDLHDMLLRVRTRLDDLGPHTLRGLLADLPRESTDTVRTLIGIQVEDILSQLLDRARVRGELGPSPLPTRAMMLPFDLARHEIIIAGGLPDDAVDEIIDVCVIPLWRTQTGCANRL
ncbi:MAG: TetR/AcrR family transcriptional regulator [Gordonia sp. (in: high G+C Gram-positive bacteria)]